MKITVKKLKELDACGEAIEEFKKRYKVGVDIKTLIRRMINEEYRLDWANWLIVRSMTRKQYLHYAVYAAEQVIDIYEKEYPDDKRPRKAIEATKAVIKNDNKKTRGSAWAARAAAEAAEAAAWAAWAAGAAEAAGAAAWAAGAAAAGAAEAAEAAGAAGAAEAAEVAEGDGAAMRIRILTYGLKLLESTT